MAPMDFRELFPDAQERSLDGESVIFGGKTIILYTLRRTVITPTPIDAVGAAWIDGGNATLASTPSRAIALIKACAIRTRGLRRERMDTAAMIVSVTASDDAFIIRTKHVSGDASVAQALPNTILRKELAHSDEERALLTPIMLIDILRTLAEHELSLRALADDCDIVIKDGSLRTPDRYLRAHCATADRRVFALAKTSALLTSMGRPLVNAVMDAMGVAPAIEDDTAWSARLDASAVCARLHPNARHAFMIENADAQSADTESSGTVDARWDVALALLRAWSADMAFIGYPYPLVLTDQMARVTNQERDMWRAMLAADASSAVRLRSELRASDAHDMLEHILYGNRGF